MKDGSPVFFPMMGGHGLKNTAGQSPNAEVCALVLQS
jgi:hypothetical protein